ncbi:hypothetical protein LJR290_006544 [Variovorax sp. LjRoot290]|uniref:hypothetical protein n=1 Tax=unclassified Variovorax TaxID=663243 RepID=UPI003ECF146B
MSPADHHTGGGSERRQLTEVYEITGPLQTEFGLRPPRHPDLRAMLARLIA